MGCRNPVTLIICIQIERLVKQFGCPIILQFFLTRMKCFCGKLSKTFSGEFINPLMDSYNTCCKKISKQSMSHSSEKPSFLWLAFPCGLVDLTIRIETDDWVVAMLEEQKNEGSLVSDVSVLLSTLLKLRFDDFHFYLTICS